MSANDLLPAADMELVTMISGGAHFGVPVMGVRDVLDTPVLYRTPLAPPEIAGSINLRGRIVTAIDLRVRLGGQPRAPGARCMCVIVERRSEPAGEQYALLVDEIGEVLTLPASAYEPNPITLAPDWAQVCRGLYRREASLLLVLDIDAILEAGQRAVA